MMFKQLFVIVAIPMTALGALTVSSLAADTIGIPQQLQALDAKITALQDAVKPRKYYLTNDQVNGANALTACAAGFHMANFFEIFDTTNLQYDTTRGQTRGDSGSGPPSAAAGWIRTGFSHNSHSLSSGEDNCEVWTSASSGDRGSAVWLTAAWSENPSAISPWDPKLFSCDTSVPVWCVQNQ